MEKSGLRILVVGVSGMLGHTLFKFLSANEKNTVFGSTRSPSTLQYFEPLLRPNIHCHVDVERPDHLLSLFASIRPNVIINCVGLVKQLSESKSPLAAIPINSILPHRLARMAELTNTRLIHVSTDCVFEGTKGNYSENDTPDARDLYGLSKLLGEVDYPHSITLRTSIIGPEINSTSSLLGWFLSQTGPVKGYQRAFFSGLPTIELARVIQEFVLPSPELYGLYHVSAQRISKLDLLRLVATIYEKDVIIEPDEDLVIDRSLDSSRFQSVTGYKAPTWPELIRRMKEFG